MSQTNSALPFSGADAQNLLDSLGIPQHSGAAGENWYLVFNGLIIQGGTISLPAAPTVFPFVTGFTQQVLGVFLQSQTAGQTPAVTATTLADFTVDHGGTEHTAYWIAIGV